MGQNHPSVWPGGLPGGGGDQKALRLGVELLTWLMQPPGWNALRYQGISYPRVSEWGQSWEGGRLVFKNWLTGL